MRSTAASHHVSQTRGARLLSAHIADHMYTNTRLWSHITYEKSKCCVKQFVCLPKCVCVKAFWHFAQRQTAALSSGKIRQSSSASIQTYQFHYPVLHMHRSKITDVFGLGKWGQACRWHMSEQHMLLQRIHNNSGQMCPLLWKTIFVRQSEDLLWCN